MLLIYQKSNAIEKYVNFFPKKLQYPWLIATNSIYACFKTLPIFYSECGKMLTAIEAYYSDDSAKEGSTIQTSINK